MRLVQFCNRTADTFSERIYTLTCLSKAKNNSPDSCWVFIRFTMIQLFKELFEFLLLVLNVCHCEDMLPLKTH